MSVIHSSWALLGCRSALRAGTARCSTVRSMAYSRQARASTASPIHSRRPARVAAGVVISVGSIGTSPPAFGLSGLHGRVYGQAVTARWRSPWAHGCSIRRRRSIKRLDLCLRQREGERFGVAGRLPLVLRAGDWQDTLLLDEPPQRHLRRGPGMALPDLTQQGHHRLRVLEAITSVVAAEAPNPLGPVPWPVLAGEGSLRQRLVRDQRDPQFP